MNNKFIVVEGLEGAGKTCSCISIKNTLEKYGIKNIILIREPGSTEIGEKIRELIINTNYKQTMVNETELLLIYAARKQLLETIIKPELKKGTWIISDRFDMSSYAYQGGGLKINMNFIQTLRDFLIGNIFPDLTIYLDIDPIIGLKRISKNRKLLDRIETKSIDFFIRTRNKYLKIIKNNSKSIIINANKNLELVQNEIKISIKNWLSNQLI